MIKLDDVISQLSILEEIYHEDQFHLEVRKDKYILFINDELLSRFDNIESLHDKLDFAIQMDRLRINNTVI